MLGFFLALATGAAVAVNPVVANPDLPKTTVQYRDLNLNTVEGKKHLEARIRHAVTEICGDEEIGNLERASEINRCRASASASTRAQVELAVDKARTGNGGVTAAAVAIVGTK